MTAITSQRLTLRRFSCDDSQQLFKLDNDPEVMRYINGGIPTPMEVINTRSLPLMLNHDGSPFGFWAAQRNASDEFIGWFSLRTTGPDETQAELGYRLHRSAWGKGYASEGSRALLSTAFANSDLATVTAQTYEKNLPSQRVLEKLGMQRIRVFKLSDDDLGNTDTSYQGSAQVWDGVDYEYALTKHLWVARYKLGVAEE